MNSSRSVEAVSRSLESLRARARGLLLARGVMMLVAFLIAACLAAGTADYLLRTPGWLRMILWFIGAGVLGAAGLRWIGPALRFRPTLTELALRIEKSSPGRSAGLAGVLASGIELGRAVDRGEIGGVGAEMVAPVVVEAASRFQRVRASSLLTSAGARRSGLHLGLAVAVLAAVGTTRPELARIGTARVLAPWSGAEWPKRTQVADATGESVHPLGVALPLRAAMLRGARVDENDRASRVWAMYRVIAPTDTGRGEAEDGGAAAAGPLTKVLLTNQHKVVEAPAEGDAIRPGVLFERLIEPAGLLASSSSRSGKTPRATPDMDLEYWFETADDRTPVKRMKLVEPPAVMGATAQVVEPEYVRRPADPQAEGGPRSLDLGPGTDERANPPGMIAGSHVTLRITLNKPVPGPVGSTLEQRGWIRRTLGENMTSLAERESVRTTFDGATWELSWPLLETARIPVKARDQYGLTGPDEPVFRFEAIPDQPPTAAVTRPESDEAVLASAVIDTAGEGRDDVGLASVALERRTARRPASSAGAPAEPIDDWAELAATPGVAGGTKQVTVESTLDLSQRPLRPGDEVWLTAVVTDAYSLDGQSHGTVRSAIRKLSIISKEDLAAQIWRELEGVRRAAIRLDDEQARVAQQAARGGEADKAQRTQAATTDRIARERQDTGKLQERMDRNRMDDREMRDLLEQATQLLDRAGKESVQATAALEEMSRAEGAGAEPTAQQKSTTAEAQREVRDSLEELAGLLDKGQDTWAMKRALERALEEQRDLRQQTENASRRTTGKSPSELSAQERAELSQIGREQRALAERTAEAIEKMLRDKDQVKEKDPATAKAVEDAAKRGQRDRVADKMNQAAQQVEQNQGNSATSDQQQAEQSLQQMLDDMNSASRNKDQELRRMLASLIESINALIRDQERQLEALEKAASLPNFAGLDAGMLRLNQNTLGVMDEAGKGPREVAPVVEILGKAADAQGTAVAALRRATVDEDAARAPEELSLERLRQARDLAEKIDQQAAQREADRKAAELKKAYREALTEQVAIKGETDPLVGIEATRRTRASARALGERQQALKDKLTELRDKTKELSEAVVFDYAHRRLDEVMGAAAATLSGGEATTAVERQQRSAIRVLQSLVEALDRSGRNNDDDFRENPGGNGGGGGQNGQRPLVPPVAQLRLLKALQVEAADLTRAAGEGADPAAVDEAAQLQGDLAGRAEQLLKKLMERPTDDKPGGGRGDAPQPQ